MIGRELRSIRETNKLNRLVVARRMLDLGEKGVAPMALCSSFMTLIEDRDGIRKGIERAPERVRRYLQALDLNERQIERLREYHQVDKLLDDYLSYSSS
jgi:hypothetical protein